MQYQTIWLLLKEWCPTCCYRCAQGTDGGKTALDAVEIAIKHLEDDPTFNAGHGGALNSQGKVELNAIIVDGKLLEFGAVAAVENIANPISLARLVMEKSDRVMLVGKGTNLFAEEMKIPSIDPK